MRRFHLASGRDVFGSRLLEDSPGAINPIGFLGMHGDQDVSVADFSFVPFTDPSHSAFSCGHAARRKTSEAMRNSCNGERTLQRVSGAVASCICNAKQPCTLQHSVGGYGATFLGDRGSGQFQGSKTRAECSQTCDAAESERASTPQRRISQALRPIGTSKAFGRSNASNTNSIAEAR